MQIGSYTFNNPLVLAPMAGISDQPLRELCFKFGADLCVSEMLSSKTALWDSQKSQKRLPTEGNAGVRIVQLVGVSPEQLAESARYYVAQGAQIIDINMGCPAKKVCTKAAGSALLKDPQLVAQICQQVVAAVPVPVTLKIRTGWCPETRNAVAIARIAQDSGIQALTIHGRTRACRFVGAVEYASIAAVKKALSIPVIANGDIDSPQKAQHVLDYTGADGLMIGRAAQGNPWIFQTIKQYLRDGSPAVAPSPLHIIHVMRTHLDACHQYYGAALGCKVARKHASAYFENWFANATQLRATFNHLENVQAQLSFLDQLAEQQTERKNSAAHSTITKTITKNELKGLAA